MVCNLCKPNIKHYFAKLRKEIFTFLWKFGSKQNYLRHTSFHRNIWFFLFLLMFENFILCVFNHIHLLLQSPLRSIPQFESSLFCSYIFDHVTIQWSFLHKLRATPLKKSNSSFLIAIFQVLIVLWDRTWCLVPPPCLDFVWLEFA